MDSDYLSDWLAYINSNRPNEDEFGLARLQGIFSKIVTKPLASKTIMIGGTNGKGTTAEYLKNFLINAGYKVGLYTSPHLIDFNERIQINGKNIEDKRVVEAFKVIEALKYKTRLTYFDYVTLAAFEIFSKESLDFVILEIGVGGKFDPVNLIDSDISVVTNISKDHEKWLGSSLEEIGRQKSAIFKKDKVGILGAEEMPNSITSKAQETCSQVYHLGKDFLVESKESQWSYSFGQKEFFLDALKLGNLNKESASCALTAFKILSDREIDFNQSLANTFLKGRCDVVGNFVLDVSHNPASVQNLTTFLRTNYKDTKFNAIFSSMSDKDTVSIIKNISSFIANWNICFIDDERFNLLEQKELIESLTKKHVKQFDSVYSAVKRGYHEQYPYVVFGSFITVSEAYKAIKKIKDKSSVKD